MGEIFTVADIRRDSGWREALEERQNYEDERRKRELAKEQEQQQARKAREAETASANWYDAVDTRVRAHFKDWAWAAIDERIQQYIEIAQKPLVEATGDVFGRFRAQLRAEFKQAIEETVDAFGAEIAVLERRLASNNQVAMVSWVDGRVEAAFTREREAAVAAQRLLETKLAALEDRPGKLPVAKTWRPESVSYQAEFVTHEGSLYQAKTDTAQAPGGSDWVCVARAGCDGQSVKVRGAFNATANYKRFDIVSLDGTAFIARRDNPGIPGISEDGWQLMSRAGGRGPVGEIGPRGRKGERGARGEAAPTIATWTLDRKNYRAVPTMSNGTQGAVLELRGLFEQFVEETSHAAE